VNWILAAGILLFSAWLLDTGLGRRSLALARPRRNWMGPLAPLGVFVIWIGPPELVKFATRSLTEGLPDWRALLWDNLLMTASGMITAGLVLSYAHFRFARGLKGFGLRRRGLLRDFGAACATLLSVWPLVLAMLLLVTWVGRTTQGGEYEIEAHPGLQQLAEHPRPALILVIVLMATVVAPLSEELVFRGILQSLLGSHTRRPWFAIVATSLLFAMVHGNPTHWPPLLILSLGMGYSYEKSGSLWRPIFMHALFNGVTVASNLLG
jgi:membrane protease YdiL (CAAX protease family)